MTQYNLLKDCYVEALTVSGTGSLSLTQTDILKLYDTITDSSGITILNSDILCLDISLYKRIRLDAVCVYMDVSGDKSAALPNIDFYYRDNESDEYQLAGKLVNDDMFCIDPNLVIFAPKNIRVTVSGIDASLYEIKLLNYDYNIAFGEDGSLTEKQLYVEDEYSTISIYNNSSDASPATAYVAVDPSSGDLCEYVKISDTVDGTYVGISDASIGIGTGQDFTYNFRMGTYYNTVVSTDGASVSTIKSSDIDTAFHTRVDIPIGQGAYNGWGVGQNSWDFTDDGVVYTIAITSDSLTLYLFRMNNESYEWFNCGPINILGKIPNALASMAILGNYAYILVNSSGAFGRIPLDGSPLILEELATCPHGTFTSKRVQGICSDDELYIYSAAVSYNTTSENGMFVRYNVASNAWTTLNSAFGYNNNVSVYYYLASRLCLVYDKQIDYIYMDCGIYNDVTDCIGFQAYIVTNNTWVVPWRSATYQYGHAMSYYADYLVYCGYEHGYNAIVYNIRTGVTTSLVLDYNQTSNYYGNSSAALYVSRIICYPKNDGSVGVMVAGGPNQKVYNFSLGVDGYRTVVGTYTTPVFDMGTETSAAYFYTNRSVPSGTSISYGGIDNYDSMLLRGFDVAPLPFAKVFTTYKPTTSTFAFMETDLGDKSKIRTFNMKTDVSPWNGDQTYKLVKRVFFDSRNYDLIFYVYDTYSSDYASICRWSLESESTIAVTSNLASYILTTTTKIVNQLTVDGYGNTWLYNGSVLYFFDTSLTVTALSISDTAADFAFAISGSKVLPKCWYTNKSSKKLECVDSSSNKSFSISMGNPQHLCALVDGGCAVVDKNDNLIYRFSSSGEVVTTCPISSSYTIIDLKEDLSNTDTMYYWLLLSNGALVRIKEDGTIFGEITLPFAEGLSPFMEGVVVSAPSIKLTYQISSGCELVYTWNYSAYGSVCDVSAVAYVPYYTLASDTQDYLIDVTNDPVWGKAVDNWAEVRIDNSYFGGKKYYQMKFQLTKPANLEAPYIDKIYFSKAVKLVDIYPGNYKDIYIKTDIPEVCEEKEYSGELRCWWTRRES